MHEQKLTIAVASIAASPVGLVMFVFADAIFVSMSKSHRLNDAVDQQERSRHLRPHLLSESIHNRLVQPRDVDPGAVERGRGVLDGFVTAVRRSENTRS